MRRQHQVSSTRTLTQTVRTIAKVSICFLIWSQSTSLASSNTDRPAALPHKTAPAKPSTQTIARSTRQLHWQKYIQSRAQIIDAKIPGQKIGFYIKDLSTGKDLSFRGDEIWYIASGIKIPVALEVLRNVDQGAFTLNTRLEVTSADYIDGAGETNYVKPGSELSVRFFLEQSLMFSDNTATDILIRKVGLDKVNEYTQSLVPNGFKPITTLADVRRLAFGKFHPDASRLSNMDFIRIRVHPDENARLENLAKLLKVKRTDLKHTSYDAGFSLYYADQVNSGTLRAFGQLLEKVALGSVLQKPTQRFLMSTLERTETGNDRIKSGLPENYVYAHKTGSQHGRICDFGILTNGKPKSKKLVIAACVRDVFPPKDAEAALSELGRAIHESGVFGGKRK